MIPHPLKNRIRKALGTTLLAGFVLGLAGAGGCRTEERAAAEQPGPLPINSFRRDWNTPLDLERDRVSDLFVRGDRVFAYTRGGRSAIFSRDTGTLQQVHRVRGGEFELHPPVVLRNQIVYPTPTALQVYAPDGRFLKTIPLEFAVRTDAAGAGTDVFFGADFPRGGGGRMVSLDVTREYAPLRWAMMAARGGFESRPVLVEDVLYFAGLDGNVYAVNAGDRDPVWATPGNVFRTNGPITADLAADANTVYAASTDSVLYALNRLSGQRKWQYFAGVPLREGPVVTADRLYQPVPGRGIAVLNPNEGQYNREPLWVAEDAVQFLSQDDRYAYLLHEDRSIVAHDKVTGEEKFRTRRRDLEVFATNPTDSTIYAATREGRVIGIRPVLEPGLVGEQVRDDSPRRETPAVAAR